MSCHIYHDTVGLGECLWLALRRRVGLPPDAGERILAGIDRYRPWVRHAGTYAAIPRDKDVRDVGINRAVAPIADREIRRSRAHGPNRALRELGRRRGSRPATTVSSPPTGAASSPC